MPEWGVSGDRGPEGSVHFLHGGITGENEDHGR